MKIGDLVETNNYGPQHVHMMGIIVGKKIYMGLPESQCHFHVYWRDGHYDSIVDSQWIRKIN